MVIHILIDLLLFLQLQLNQLYILCVKADLPLQRVNQSLGLMEFGSEFVVLLLLLLGLGDDESVLLLEVLDKGFQLFYAGFLDGARLSEAFGGQRGLLGRERFLLLGWILLFPLLPLLLLPLLPLFLLPLLLFLPFPLLFLLSLCSQVIKSDMLLILSC